MITNKSLVIIIIAVISLSILSTLFSLGVLSNGRLLFPTGKATSAAAEVSVYFTQGLSITTADSDTIDFGGCSAGGNVIYSNETGGNPSHDCASFTPTAILVRNDGNTKVNLSVVASDWGEAHGGTFLNSSTNDSWIAYAVVNDSSMPFYHGGCYGHFNSSWSNITSNDFLPVCDDLRSNSTNNSISFNIAVYIPNSTLNGQNNITFTFWASPLI